MRLRNPLALLGSHARLAVALSLLAGLALPDLAATVRPYLGVLIFLLLLLAFLRIGFGPLFAETQRPRAVFIAVLLAQLVLPLLALLTLGPTGFGETLPWLALALFISLGAPAITGVPGFAAIMGLNGAAALAMLIAGMVLVPLTAPAVATLLPTEAISIDPSALALRLLILLGASAGGAAAARLMFGEERIAAASTSIDGASVVILFLFAIAAMDGLAAALVTEPLFVLALLGGHVALSLAQYGLGVLVFSASGPGRSEALALGMGLRNMGLMVAALGGAVPHEAWLWFAVGQFPIYLTPYVAGFIARHRPA